MKIRRNINGFSLVEILIVAGLVGVVMMVFMSSLVSMQNSQKSIAQKFEVTELTGLMQKLVNDTTKCNAQILGKHVDTTGMTTTPGTYELNLTRLRFGSDPAAPVIAEATQPLPGTSSGMEATSVKLRDFTRLDPGAGPPAQLLANFEVAFKAANMPTPLRPAKAQVLLNLLTTDPPNNMTITSCGAPPSAGGGGAGVFVVAHEENFDVDGGVCGIGTWTTRKLNVSRTTNIAGATFDAIAHTVTLPPGNYRVYAYSVADSSGDHQARLIATDGSVQVLGSSAYASDSSGDANASTIVGHFAINAATTFKIEHMCGDTPSTRANRAYVLGGSTGFSPIKNVYGLLEFTAE